MESITRFQLAVTEEKEQVYTHGFRNDDDLKRVIEEELLEISQEDRRRNEHGCNSIKLYLFVRQPVLIDELSVVLILLI